MRYLRADTDQTEMVGPFLDKTDGVSLEIGLAGDASDISKDGLAFGTGPVLGTYDSHGMYPVAITVAMTGTEGSFFLSVDDPATHLHVWHEFTVIPQKVYDSMILGTDTLEVDAIAISASTTAADDLEANISNVARALVSGTADSGDTLTLVDSVRTEADDYWNGQLLVITSGTLLGQSRVITNFVASSNTITVSPAFSAVVGTQTYEIWPITSDTATVLTNVALIPTTAMRGTDSAALASVCTEGRLAELAAANLPLNIDAILADTDAVNTLTATNLDATVSSRATPAQVNTEADNALVDINLDRLLKVAVLDADVIDGSVFATLVSKEATAGWDDYEHTTDSLQALRARGDVAWITGAGGSDPVVLVNTTIATLATQLSFTLTAGSDDDEAYTGAVIIVTDQVTSTQKVFAIITAYTGSTKTVTLGADPGIFTMATGDTVDVVMASGLTAKIDVIDAEIGAIDTVVDAIPTTAMRGTDSAALASVCTEGRLAELAAANLPLNIDALTSSVGAIPTTAMRGTDSAALASVCTEGRLAELAAANLPLNIDAILADTDAVNTLTATNLDATVSSRATPAQVNTEVVDVLTVDTHAEVAGVVAATSTLKDKINWIFALLRNKRTTTATTDTLRNDADGADIATSTVSDDATTFTRTEWT